MSSRRRLPWCGTTTGLTELRVKEFDRWLAEVSATVLEEAADALVKLTPYGMELLPDGREDKQAAAYVEGVHTSHDWLRARATQIREEGRA